MVFFGQIAGFIFEALPSAIVFCLLFPAIIVAILIVRRRTVERKLLGVCRGSFWRELAGDLFMGILAGYFASYIMFALGIAFDAEGMGYVLLVALALMLLDLRYICLAYAGGLLSLFSLLTGTPKLHVPGLLAMVAVLHITESALIMTDGDRRAMPVYLKRPDGTVGGFLLQRVWPIPLLILGMIAARESSGATIPTPSWWPLIPLHLTVAAPMIAIYAPVLAAAALGYGDLAITGDPRRMARRTSAMLGLYSLILLALAVAAARLSYLAWAAALFAPVGHELVLYFSRRFELSGKPAFTSRADGVSVLAVLPESRAQQAGIKSGDLIFGLNGQNVLSKSDFLARLGDSSILTSVDLLRRNRKRLRCDFRGDAKELGLILAPDPDEPAQIEVGRWRFLPGNRRENF